MCELLVLICATAASVACLHTSSLLSGDATTPCEPPGLLQRSMLGTAARIHLVRIVRVLTDPLSVPSCTPGYRPTRIVAVVGM